MYESLPSIPPVLDADGADAEAFRADTLLLLRERTARFTMGDSTSVPIETAESLLSGILYCMDLHQRTLRNTLQIDALSGENIRPKSLFEAGMEDALRIKKRCGLLLRQAEQYPPPVENEGYCETLVAIGTYLKGYDASFFADSVPADIVYPLAIPVPETLLGPEYALDYLRRLLCENALLRKYSASTLAPLLTRCYGDYVGLLVNLYAPVAEASVGRTLSGLSLETLFLHEAARRAAFRQLRSLSEEDARSMLACAASEVCVALSLGTANEAAYLTACANELLPRIRACADTALLEGVFPAAYDEVNPSPAPAPPR